MQPPDTAAGPSGWAHFDRAQHYLQIERYDLAEQELRAALREDPQEPTLHAMRGWALHGLGKLPEAREEAGTALQLDPEHIDALVLLGRLCLDEGRHQEAEQLWLEALRIDPLEPQLYLNYAALMQRTGHLEKAEKLLRKCLELDPENSNAHSALGIVLAERRKAEPAAAHGRHGVRLDPEGDVPHAFLGHTYLATGHPFRARTHLREALRLNPGDTDVEKAFLEADRATRWIYLPMYFWCLWVDRLPGKQFMVWAVVLGLVGALRAAGAPPKSVTLFVFAYLVSCIYTWFAGPLAALWIRMKPPR